MIASLSLLTDNVKGSTNMNIGNATASRDDGPNIATIAAIVRASGAMSTASGASVGNASLYTPNGASANDWLSANARMGSSITVEERASAASVASRPFNPASLAAASLRGVDARQAMIDRVKQQEIELEFLRAQVLLTRVPSVTPASQLQFQQGLSRTGSNQPFMVPPALRLQAAGPGQADNALSLLASSSAHLHDVSTRPVPAPVDITKGTFPMKLHQMLSDLERQPGGTEIASFLPHGNAFAIHKPREFVRRVMPKHFRMSRFSSFQRQLNLYDFLRITTGLDRGAYSHPLFVYGKPDLTATMKRNKIKGVKNKVKNSALLVNSAKNEEGGKIPSVAAEPATEDSGDSVSTSLVLPTALQVTTPAIQETPEVQKC